MYFPSLASSSSPPHRLHPQCTPTHHLCLFFFSHSLAYAALFWSLALVLTVDWQSWQFPQCLVRQNSSWKASIQNKEQTTAEKGRLKKTEPGEEQYCLLKIFLNFPKRGSKPLKDCLNHLRTPTSNHLFILPQTHHCLASISPSVFFLVILFFSFSHTLLTVTSSYS